MYATSKMQQILFIDLFKTTLHVLGDKLAHPQEHFLTAYTAFGTMHWYCCWPVTRLRWNFTQYQINYNKVNHWMFLKHSVIYFVIINLVQFNCNFSKEQSMLPEDDRMIETCRSVLSILMCNFRLLKTIYVHLLVCYLHAHYEICSKNSILSETYACKQINCIFYLTWFIAKYTHTHTHTNTYQKLLNRRSLHFAHDLYQWHTPEPRQCQQERSHIPCLAEWDL